jgi:hypothetical protein
MKELSQEEMKDISGGGWFGCALSFGATVGSAFAQAYFWTLVGAFNTARCVMDELQC